jgi:hypothetical protein
VRSPWLQSCDSFILSFEGCSLSAPVFPGKKSLRTGRRHRRTSDATRRCPCRPSRISEFAPSVILASRTKVFLLCQLRGMSTSHAATVASPYRRLTARFIRFSAGVTDGRRPRTRWPSWRSHRRALLSTPRTEPLRQRMDWCSPPSPTPLLPPLAVAVRPESHFARPLRVRCASFATSNFHSPCSPSMCSRARHGPTCATPVIATCGCVTWPTTVARDARLAPPPRPDFQAEMPPNRSHSYHRPHRMDSTSVFLTERSSGGELSRLWTEMVSQDGHPLLWPLPVPSQPLSSSPLCAIGADGKVVGAYNTDSTAVKWHLLERARPGG